MVFLKDRTGEEGIGHRSEVIHRMSLRVHLFVGTIKDTSVVCKCKSAHGSRSFPSFGLIRCCSFDFIVVVCFLITSSDHCSCSPFLFLFLFSFFFSFLSSMLSLYSAFIPLLLWFFHSSHCLSLSHNQPIFNYQFVLPPSHLHCPWHTLPRVWTILRSTAAVNGACLAVRLVYSHLLVFIYLPSSSVSFTHLGPVVMCPG